MPLAISARTAGAAGARFDSGSRTATRARKPSARPLNPLCWPPESSRREPLLRLQTDLRRLPSTSRGPAFPDLDGGPRRFSTPTVRKSDGRNTMLRRVRRPTQRHVRAPSGSFPNRDLETGDQAHRVVLPPPHHPKTSRCPRCRSIVKYAVAARLRILLHDRRNSPSMPEPDCVRSPSRHLRPHHASL